MIPKQILIPLVKNFTIIGIVIYVDIVVIPLDIIIVVAVACIAIVMIVSSVFLIAATAATRLLLTLHNIIDRQLI